MTDFERPFEPPAYAQRVTPDEDPLVSIPCQNRCGNATELRIERMPAGGSLKVSYLCTPCLTAEAEQLASGA